MGRVCVREPVPETSRELYLITVNVFVAVSLIGKKKKRKVSSSSFLNW